MLVFSKNWFDGDDVTLSWPRRRRRGRARWRGGPGEDADAQCAVRERDGGLHRWSPIPEPQALVASVRGRLVALAGRSLTR